LLEQSRVGHLQERSSHAPALSPAHQATVNIVRVGFGSRILTRSDNVKQIKLRKISCHPRIILFR
jgi:hypothetical protein